MFWALVLVAALSACSALNVHHVPSDFLVDDEILSRVSNEIADDFADAYISFMKTGQESSLLRQVTQELAAQRTNIDLLNELDEASVGEKFLTCTTCRATMNIVARTFLDPEGELNGPNRDEDAKKVMLHFCERFDIQTQEVCSGLFDLNWPIIDYILQNTIIDSRSFCGSLPISFCKVKQEEFNYNLKIDNNGGNVDKPKSEIPSKGSNDFKILQLTDIHYDPEYKHGAVAECDEPLCCQRMPTGAVALEKLAGYWSDYRVCDSPLHMIEEAFDHMKATHEKIDYIYHTGDIVSHTVWDTSIAGNKDMITKIDDLIAEKFPGIKVFPCVGNHDSHPSNVFSPAEAPAAINSQWLYEHLYSSWSKWLPAETKDTILKGGYYTVSPHAGFRIISLNNLDCYVFNWWLFYDGSRTIEQLQWLHDTLLAAEKAGEYVHILAHIPSGSSDCWNVWSREFGKLVERFHHIISGVFNGHTHLDEMHLFYSSKGHAVGVAWNGGSLTSFTNKNPNYRIYDVERANMQVVDHETWTFNLTEANAHGPEKKPEWFVLYQFSKDFTSDLSPAGIDALLEEMASNPQLLHKYWRFRQTAADPQMEVGCDNKCLMSTICRLARYSYENKNRCRELQAKLEPNLETTTSSTTEVTTESTTKKPGSDDGAASMMALQMSTIVALIALMKFFF